MFVVITLKITFEVLGKKNVCVCLITDTAFLNGPNSFVFIAINKTGLLAN